MQGYDVFYNNFVRFSRCCCYCFNLCYFSFLRAIFDMLQSTLPHIINKILLFPLQEHHQLKQSRNKLQNTKMLACEFD